ncbi:hypothetical protein GC722_02620 [Auraticoccus sp. F435]|uniref:Uncharacterized protein n=1 Tax=Auraticoccus cholistanensis TaxID=2656650 RepID=A0A6A9UPV8_9ACTN|nr:hypothetical protein [Auraticoccus cholistanensis]MVA74926.1 hypothetical protein [Auraticoccus cholistanensis]
MTTISSVLAEALRLAARTGQLWWRLWPQLIGVLLLGWVGYYLALIASVELTTNAAWVVVPTFAAGLVSLLASIVITLRLVASQLGVTALVRSVSGPAALDAPDDEDDDRDASVVRLLIITLLPFLAVYASFGYVDDLASELALLSGYTAGLGDSVLGRLNPVGSTRAVLTVVAAVVGLYLLRRVVDACYQRTRWRLLGLATAFVEACFLLLTVLSAFRLVEQVQLWWSDRRLVGWWDTLLADLAAGFAVLRVDLPEVLQRIGTFGGEVLWPVFWERITEPVAWLAMAALVFGSRVVSVADLWRKGEPLSARLPGARRMRIARRLQQEATGSTGVRRVVLQAQEALLGDIDDKYLPTLQSLRLVLRAGAVFLGAYVLTFTAMRLLGLGLEVTVRALIGGRDGDTWVLLQPFLALDDTVLTTSVQVTLLAVAFSRALSIFADRAPEEPAATASRPPRLPVGVTRRLRPVGQLGVALALCLVLAAADVLIDRTGEVDVARTRVGEPGPLGERVVTVSDPTFGQLLRAQGDTEAEIGTPGAFVVVPVEVASPGRSGPQVAAELVHGERRYTSQFSSTGIGPDAGFVSRGDFVFEVDTADIGPNLRLELSLRELYSGYSPLLEVDLGLDSGRAERVRADLGGSIVDFQPFPATRGITP